MTHVAMFPLGIALLPGEVLPLRIFEPRYRRLLVDCLWHNAPFGVVLIDRGSEVGGGDVRRDLGVLARLIRVDPQPDGTFAVLAVGADRIRVIRWLTDDPYPSAEVELWPEDDAEAGAAYRAAAQLGPQDRYELLGAATAEHRRAVLAEALENWELARRFDRGEQ